ncbi:MAG: hypothetical protein KUG82_18635 [Pseudomonadales bacterium]|nr:hypothetical protein [Pseudomonadales bacterium]
MSTEAVHKKMLSLYEEILNHEGFGEMRVEVRILRRGQKEVIIHCGKQYRYVVDYKNSVDYKKNVAGKTSKVEPA